MNGKRIIVPSRAFNLPLYYSSGPFTIIYLFIGAGSGADTAAAGAAAAGAAAGAGAGGGDAAEMRGVLKKDYAPSFDTAIGGAVSFFIN
eukprot:COSAG06_NODE_1693_length_8701_cov_80.626133_10_plen_89_part_00